MVLDKDSGTTHSSSLSLPRHLESSSAGFSMAEVAVLQLCPGELIVSVVLVIK
jgi:hypothetical protein